MYSAVAAANEGDEGYYTKLSKVLKDGEKLLEELYKFKAVPNQNEKIETLIQGFNFLFKDCPMESLSCFLNKQNIEDRRTIDTNLCLDENQSQKFGLRTGEAFLVVKLHLGRINIFNYNS